MKFTKKWKNFCQLQKHTTGGFTLVELIVVIAILTILAGIAVPAYSGYIAKANEAADQQLLAAVNQAFVAACIENSVDITGLKIDTAIIELIGNVGTKMIDESSVIKPDVVKEDFLAYYAGSENVKFKVYEDIFFDPEVHAFVENEEVAYAYGDSTIYLSASQIAMLKSSSYGDIGADKLMGQIDTLSMWAGANNLEGMSGDGFAAAMMSYLGFEDKDEWIEYMSSKGDDAGEITTNAMVLYAAQNSSNVTTGGLTTLLDSTDIIGDLTSDPNATGLANAGAIYGLYLAYAETNTTDENLDWDDPTRVLEAATTDSTFKSWVATDSGKSELNAYLAAMDVLGSNAENSSTATSILENGYDDEGLVDLMQQILGQ